MTTEDKVEDAITGNHPNQPNPIPIPNPNPNPRPNPGGGRDHGQHLEIKFVVFMAMQQVADGCNPPVRFGERRAARRRGVYRPRPQPSPQPSPNPPPPAPTPTPTATPTQVSRAPGGFFSSRRHVVLTVLTRRSRRSAAPARCRQDVVKRRCSFSPRHSPSPPTGLPRADHRLRAAHRAAAARARRRPDQPASRPRGHALVYLERVHRAQGAAAAAADVRLRALVILVDGVDEAAELREIVEAFVHYELVRRATIVVRLARGRRPRGLQDALRRDEPARAVAERQQGPDAAAGQPLLRAPRPHRWCRRTSTPVPESFRSRQRHWWSASACMRRRTRRSRTRTARQGQGGRRRRRRRHPQPQPVAPRRACLHESMRQARRPTGAARGGRPTGAVSVRRQGTSSRWGSEGRRATRAAPRRGGRQAEAAADSVSRPGSVRLHSARHSAAPDGSTASRPADVACAGGQGARDAQQQQHRRDQQGVA